MPFLKCLVWKVIVTVSFNDSRFQTFHLLGVGLKCRSTCTLTQSVGQKLSIQAVLVATRGCDMLLKIIPFWRHKDGMQWSASERGATGRFSENFERKKDLRVEKCCFHYSAKSYEVHNAVSTEAILYTSRSPLSLLESLALIFPLLCFGRPRSKLLHSAQQRLRSRVEASSAWRHMNFQ